MKAKILILGIFCMIFLSTVQGAGVEIEDVYVEPSNAKPGEDITLVIETNVPNARLDVEIYDEGVKIYDDDVETESNGDISIPSGDFEDEWEDFMYVCGDHEIEVKIANHSDEDDDDETTEDIELFGDDSKKLKVTVNAADKLNTTAEIKIAVEDDDGDEIEEDDLVIIRNVDQEEDITLDTDRYGEVEFTIDDKFSGDDEVGKFDVIVRYEDHCEYKKSDAFEVMHSFGVEITSLPDNKFEVGKEIAINVKNEKGSRVTSADNMWVDGPGGYHKLLSLNSFGTTQFTPTSDGRYIVQITDDDFWSYDESIDIESLPPLKIELSKAKGEITVGDDLEITILDDSDDEVKDVEVTIKDPKGDPTKRDTDSDGKVSYTVEEIGIYTIDAKKEGYGDADETFEAYKKLSVSISPEHPDVGDTIIVKVTDEDGFPVAGITVLVNAQEDTTDSGGEISFVIDSKKKYIIEINEAGYSKINRMVEPEGVLTLRISPDVSDGVEVGDNISIEALVDGKTGVSVEITITKPDGGKDYITDSGHTFTPRSAGDYKIEVSKTGYKGTSRSFSVNLIPAEINASVKDNTVSVKVTGQGSGVEGFNVSAVLTTPPRGAEPEVYSSVTDSEGIATLTIDKNGNYTITGIKKNYNEVKTTVSVGKYDLLVLFIAGIIILILAIAYFLNERRSQIKEKPPKEKIGLGGL